LPPAAVVFTVTVFSVPKRGGSAGHRPSGPVPLRPLSAEGLHADHRADLVAVDVRIAHLHARDDVLDRLVDARMDAERQAVSGRVDRIDHLVQLVALPAHDVQRRAEDFLVQAVDRIDLEGHRREVRAVFGRSIHLRFGDQLGFAAHALAVRLEHRERVLVDHRADVGRQQARITDLQFGHRTGEHADRLVGDVVLHEQHARGRATLAGRGERRRTARP
jgi:hypothetical protein